MRVAARGTLGTRGILRWLTVAGAWSLMCAPRAYAAEVKLPDLIDARAFRIEDAWQGYSAVTPRSAIFVLALTGRRFDSSADFSVTCNDRYGSRIFRRTLPLHVRPIRFQLFLYELSQTALKPGPYAPFVGHTDDFPSITIEVETGQGKVTFFTRSQGRHHVPWAVRLGGHIYVLTTDSPMQAYDDLKPYLRLDILDGLLSAADRGTCDPAAGR